MHPVLVEQDKEMQRRKNNQTLDSLSGRVDFVATISSHVQAIYAYCGNKEKKRRKEHTK